MMPVYNAAGQEVDFTSHMRALARGIVASEQELISHATKIVQDLTTEMARAAEAGEITTDKPLSAWTIAIKKDDKFGWQSGTFWRTQTIEPVREENAVGAGARPSGMSQRESSPRSYEAVFRYLCDPNWHVVIRDREAKGAVMQWLKRKAPEVEYEPGEGAIVIPTRTFFPPAIRERLTRIATDRIRAKFGKRLSIIADAMSTNPGGPGFELRVQALVEQAARE